VRVGGSLARAGLIVSSAFLVSRVLGYIRVIVIANAFPSSELDAFFAAFRIPDLIFQLVAAGALSSALIPVVSELFTSNERLRAWRVVSTVINLMLVGLLVLAAGLFILAPVVVPIITPGFEGAKLDETIELTRIMLLSPIFLAMGAVATSVLNAGGRFAASAIAPVVYNLAIIGGALILGPSLGVQGLALSVVAGSLGHLLVQVRPLMRMGFRYDARIESKDPEARKRYVEAFARSDFDAMLNYYKRNYPATSGADLPPAPEFPKVKAPVLMFHGLDDFALHRDGLAGTWNWVEKDLTMVTVPKAGHFVHRDATEAVLDGLVVAGGIDDQLPSIRLLQDFGGGHRVRAAQLRGHREPVRVDVHHVDAHRANAFGQLEHHQAHGAGAIYQHMRPELAAQYVVAAHGAGERLDQGRIGRFNVIGEPRTVGRGHGHILCRPAGLGHANRAPAQAEVVVADAAVVALVAIQGRVDGHPVTLTHIQRVRA